MKKILIVSPNFPPLNAVDMHRVRQSLPYFREMGWHPVVLTVDPRYSEFPRDEWLCETLPAHLEIHKTRALDVRWTRKVGLGSLALRSLWFLYREGNRLLGSQKFDLVYFSTTMFPVLILGNLWKKKFGVPYIIDMQDPWHSDYYLSKPAHERPPKFWFSYSLNKYLEPIAMRQVDGIISVSQGYCDLLQQRYANITPERCTVIPFGAAEKDFQVLQNKTLENSFFIPSSDRINIVYVGRAGHDMQLSLEIIFMAFQKGLQQNNALFSKMHFYCIGTDYAPADKAQKTVLPVAQKVGVEQYVSEFPLRIPYFSALQLLGHADMLLLPGSDDANYTASKLYPYILAKKPLMAVFHQQSSVVKILADTRAGESVTFHAQADKEALATELFEKWENLCKQLPFVPATDWKAFEPYTAREMAKRQTTFFDHILALPSGRSASYET